MTTTETGLKPGKKEVQIIRKEIDSHVPVEVRQTSDHRLSSVFKDGTPHKGVSNDLEELLLPLIIDTPTKADTFRKEAKDFWRTLTLKVPSEGAVLNVSIGEDGYPIEPKDYIIYVWAQTHPFVAQSKEEMVRSGKKRFYIKDPNRETKEENEKVQLKAKAMKEYVKVLDDEKSIDRVIRVMSNTNPAKLSKELKENKLSDLLDQDPKRFYEVATDKSLEVKDFISELISHEIVRQEGNSYFYIDERMGETLDEAVAYVKDKKNSSAVGDMKAKLKEQKKLAQEKE